ncbi:MAG: alpha/beta fold hydrolase [Bryobacteraceae bacterium]|nr:alpha/beta fold hydrolase [Bryobacteraceae bacterium]
MRTRLIAVSALALLAWIAAGIVLAEGSLHPPRLPSTAEVEIRSDDAIPLRASFRRASSAVDCVIVLHGIGDSSRGALGFAPMFLEAGYHVLAPDSRAHGVSGGALVTFGVLESGDVLRWAAWLTQHAGCRKLFALGESLGGSILIQAAAQQPVFSAIVAECPYQDLQSIAEHRVAQQSSAWIAKPAVASALLYTRLRYNLDLTRASTIQAARRLQTPLLLIHGLADTNTPPSHSQAIAAVNSSIVTWYVPGAPHVAASATQPEEFRRRVLAWLRPR